MKEEDPERDRARGRGGRGDACVICEREKLRSTIPTFGDIKSSNDEDSGRVRREQEEDWFRS